MRLALKTVAVFLVCWLPISILTIAKSSSIKINPKLDSTFFTFAFANSLINPFIYFAHMRRAIATALGCIKSANLKRKSLQQKQTVKTSGNFTQSKSNVSPNVQPQVVVPASPCFRERHLTDLNKTDVDDRKTIVHLQPPKKRVNSLIV